MKQAVVFVFCLAFGWMLADEVKAHRSESSISNPNRHSGQCESLGVSPIGCGIGATCPDGMFHIGAYCYSLRDVVSLPASELPRGPIEIYDGATEVASRNAAGRWVLDGGCR